MSKQMGTPVQYHNTVVQVCVWGECVCVCVCVFISGIHTNREGVRNIFSVHLKLFC